jgi:hypothetical protein
MMPSQKPKHVASNKTDINVVVIDDLYFLSADYATDWTKLDGVSIRGMIEALPFIKACRPVWAPLCFLFNEYCGFPSPGLNRGQHRAAQSNSDVLNVWG